MHFQHFQSILSEFDPIWTPNKLTIICYFRKDLKPFIKVEMEQQNQESMDFEEIMQRVVNAEAKAGLRSSTIVRDSDACCSRGHRPSHNTSSKMQTQGSSHKDLFHSVEPKPKNPKPASSRDNAAELAKKKDRKDKKKRLWGRRREQNKQTPATGDNTKAPKKKKKRRDPNKVTCFNCDKKGHYASKCTEPPKN